MSFINWLRGVKAKIDIEPIADGNIILQDNEDGETADMYVDIGNDRLKVGGGSGHTIKDSSGDAMTQRDNLQIIGAYLGDDSTNNATKVNIVREMTSTEFEALSEAEKEGNIIVNDAPDNYVEVTADGVKTWKQLLQTLEMSINGTRLTETSYLCLGGIVASITYAVVAQPTFSYRYSSITGTINLNGYYWYQEFDASTGTTTTKDDQVPSSGTKITIYYNSMVRLLGNPSSSAIQAIYPVGSIYLNTNNVNPATFLGFGTWSLMSAGYLKNDASAATGGSSTSGSTTLTAQQIPAHSHTATTESSGAHTHTATTQNTGAHTHTATTGSYGNHTHTATTGSYGNHTHTLTTNTTGSHTHYLGGDIWGGSGTATGANLNINSSKGGGWNPTTPAAGNHSHTATTQNTGAHTHTLTTQNTGAHTHTLTTGSYGNHTHTLTTESKGEHTHTLTTQSIGGGEGHTHTIEPPYIRVYAFERTA